MRGAVLSLFGVCLAGGIGEMLLPEQTSATTRRLLRFLLALSVLLILLSPLLTLLRSDTGLFEGKFFPEQEQTDFDALFEKAVTAQSAADLEEGVYGVLEREFDIDREQCSVSVYLQADDSWRVCVFLSGSALLRDPVALEAALGERLSCLVEVR